MTAPKLSERQRAALKWLHDRGGDGVFDKQGVMLAMGERQGIDINGYEGFMRSTWNALRDGGYIEYYEPSPRSKTKRARITEAGRQALKETRR